MCKMKLAGLKCLSSQCWTSGCEGNGGSIIVVARSACV